MLDIGPPSLLYSGYWVFPGVKSGRGVTLTPHPLLMPLVMKEYSYTSTPPMDRTACTEPQCLYNGYRVFPGVKSGRGVTLTPHPLLVQWS